MPKRPTVGYWTNIPAPYTVEKFNCLSDADDICFRALFSTRTESDRSWHVYDGHWRFRHSTLSPLAYALRAIPPRMLLAAPPDLLVSLYAEPRYLIGQQLARLRGAKIASYVEVTFDTWVPRSRWKNKLKSMDFQSVDAILTCGPDGRAYAKQFGAQDSAIWEVQNPVNVGYFSPLAKSLRPGRAELRSKYEVAGPTFIYVGRLWDGKGIHHLLDSFREVAHAVPDATLLLVGDGPLEQTIRRRCKLEGLDQIRLLGFHHPETLTELYVASDVFVFPTLGDPYGLVVDEAMCCGLPVISTSAVGELELRVRNGLNGFVVPPGNAEAMAAAMIELADDEALREKMGESSFVQIQPNTPENWARNFERFALDVIEGRPSFPDGNASTRTSKGAAK